MSFLGNKKVVRKNPRAYNKPERLKILAFSDVGRWGGMKLLINRFNPDIIALAGDLVFDGFAPFYWRETLSDEIPKGKDFEKFRKDHINKFYSFLAYAGKKSKVISVRGNHDDDFVGDYCPQKINQIPGCYEVSGKTIELEGYTFLGLGYDDVEDGKKLRHMSKELARKVDVILMHGKNIRLVSSLFKPRVIIKGGLKLGACLVDDVPTVFTGPAGCAIIKLKGKIVSKISEYVFNFSRWNVFKGSAGVWLKPGEIREAPLRVPYRYGWVKPPNLRLPSEKGS